MNFNQNGKLRGLSIEYMNVIVQRLGIMVKYDIGGEQVDRL